MDAVPAALTPSLWVTYALARKPFPCLFLKTHFLTYEMGLILIHRSFARIKMLYVRYVLPCAMNAGYSVKNSLHSLFLRSRLKLHPTTPTFLFPEGLVPASGDCISHRYPHSGFCNTPITA